MYDIWNAGKTPHARTFLALSEVARKTRHFGRRKSSGALAGEALAVGSDRKVELSRELRPGRDAGLCAALSREQRNGLPHRALFGASSLSSTAPNTRAKPTPSCTVRGSPYISTLNATPNTLSSDMSSEA